MIGSNTESAQSDVPKVIIESKQPTNNLICYKTITEIGIFKHVITILVSGDSL